MIGLVECQIQTWDGIGEVWHGRMIERIRTTLKARIKQERGKRVDITEGYSNNEEALRREVGIDPEGDRSEAAGGPEDADRGHGWRRPQWDQGANLRVLDDIALLQEPADMPSQVEETDLTEGNPRISIL